MLDVSKHRQIMLRVLKAIYTDVKLRAALGFSGTKPNLT
jgi:hypothetical protein